LGLFLKETTSFEFRLWKAGQLNDIHCHAKHGEIQEIQKRSFARESSLPRKFTGRSMQHFLHMPLTTTMTPKSPSKGFGDTTSASWYHTMASYKQYFSSIAVSEFAVSGADGDEEYIVIHDVDARVCGNIRNNGTPLPARTVLVE
jgi:hypothetical protein